jgi:hypothetical protein
VVLARGRGEELVHQEDATSLVRERVVVVRALDPFTEIRCVLYGDGADLVLEHGNVIEIDHSVGQVMIEVKVGDEWVRADRPVHRDHEDWECPDASLCLPLLVNEDPG